MSAKSNRRKLIQKGSPDSERLRGAWLRKPQTQIQENRKHKLFKNICRRSKSSSIRYMDDGDFLIAPQTTV